MDNKELAKKQLLQAASTISFSMGIFAFILGVIWVCFAVFALFIVYLIGGLNWLLISLVPSILFLYFCYGRKR